MGKRGPQPKAGDVFRPNLRLSPERRAEAQALGVDQLSRLLEWALPLWRQRREGEAPRPGFDPGTVILRPQPARGREAASIWHDDQLGVLCCVRPVKDRQFWELMKNNGLSWVDARGRYERKLTALTGSPVDRVAELAHIVYGQGWPVAVGSPQMADLIIEGRWRPEQRRWVQALKSGNFLLVWEMGGDAVFQATRRLPTAHWSTDLQGTVVDAAYASDVRDFADEWGFALTQKALALIEATLERAPEERLGVKLLAANQPQRKPRAVREEPEEVTIPAHLRLED